MLPQTSASYSLTLRCRLHNRPGLLGRLTSTIGDIGGNIGAIDIISADERAIVRDITVAARDEAHAESRFFTTISTAPRSSSRRP